MLFFNHKLRRQNSSKYAEAAIHSRKGHAFHRVPTMTAIYDQCFNVQVI